MTLAEIDDYAWLIGNEAAPWLAELAHTSQPVHQQIAQLRKRLSTDRTRLVVEQVELRRRGVKKFGEWSERMFFTDIGLQQATDRWIGRHKASRFPAAALVHDLCCGIGGDCVALAGRGPVVGWEQAAEITLLAEANLRAVGAATSPQVAQVRTGDVQSWVPASGETWHLDPDRRAGGQRSIQVCHHLPGPELVDRLRSTNPDGAIKLAPACEVPPDWASSAELEWIARDRECRQLVVWFGQLATNLGERRATVVFGNQSADNRMADARFASGDTASHSFVGQAGQPTPIADTLEQYIYDPSAAVLAADLLGAFAQRHGLATLAPGAVYLTAAHRVDDPLVGCFEVIESFPLRVATLAKSLAARGIGRLEIKKRGVSIDPATLRRKLKLRGTREATLLLTRMGQRELAILAGRCPPPDTALRGQLR